MKGGFFNRLFRKRKTMETRLSAAEAERIARDAASDSYLVNQLVMQGPRDEDGHVVWHLMTPTFGAMLSVLVDDATGAAEVSQRSGRQIEYFITTGRVGIFNIVHALWNYP